jgi:uncharacterized protein DUF1592/uncharacterized protein DUF1588/uncharacterized protein DUF1587/uncharacterized protein DUF1585/uncharacterized protein DUF1595
MTSCRVILILSLSGGLGFSAPASRSPAPDPSQAPPPNFVRDVQPLLSKYCYGCHGEKRKGDLDLRLYTTEKLAAGHRPLFEKVVKNLQAHEMPPENKPQPSAAEREIIVGWVNSIFSQYDCRHPDPGRVTLRRLNRAEYHNTIRDLLGVDFKPAYDFPADDSGYGFDNIGDVLSFSTVLLEKYLAAAEKILAEAVPSTSDTNSLRPAFNPRQVESFRRVFVCQPAPTSPESAARQILTGFTKRAFRRPASTQELDRLMTLFHSAQGQGGDFENSLKQALEAVLVSPHFLFRGEPQTRSNNAQSIHPVDEYALASRLSYFLWSSMPDGELFAQAERKSLRRHLDTEVRRMLKDPKAHALVENFAGQWLQLRNLRLTDPDRKQFADFNEPLRADMQEETEHFFDYILRQNRSVLEFIDADYTFLNGRLARFYGIAGVEGDELRLVSVKGTPRGGLLTQASILTLTSNPTRTSPVKRGKWVLENLLGAPPPPPPPNVPELKEDKAALTGTLRQRMEQHRQDPNCAGCHARMDPIGFGFENFNAIGAWRDKEGELPIDPAGQLVTGESFRGPAELKNILLKGKRDQFVRCLVEKLLTYALGRGLEYYDKCAVDQISQRLAKDHYRFTDLVLGVVHSTPFQLTRDENPAPNLALQSTEPHRP